MGFFDSLKKMIGEETRESDDEWLEKLGRSVRASLAAEDEEEDLDDDDDDDDDEEYSYCIYYTSSVDGPNQYDYVKTRKEITSNEMAKKELVRYLSQNGFLEGKGKITIEDYTEW